MLEQLPTTIEEAIQRIREGSLTPTDLVEYCLARIEQFDDEIKAFVWVDAAGARRTARRLTAQNENITGPLHGIPVAIKDIIDVAGMPTKVGSPLRHHAPAAVADAPCVAAWRQAGAVILGKTVTTEWACLDPAPTRNPWNVQRSPGGSSAGSAAAVCMEMCMAALGTQTGGSILRPAAFCGVVGYKPTFDEISCQGVQPISQHLDHVGPMARNVADVRLVQRVLAPPPRAGKDAHEAPTLHCIHQYFVHETDASVQKVFDQALQKLKDATIHRDTSLPFSIDTLRARHAVLMAVDAARVHQTAYQQSPQAFGPKVSALIQQGLSIDTATYTDALQHQTRLRQTLLVVPADPPILPNVMLMYATPTTAPDCTTSTGDPSFQTPWSYAGLPTITIPCGLDEQGLPVGLQLIGRDFNVLGAAAAWCEARLGFRPHASFRRRDY